MARKFMAVISIGGLVLVFAPAVAYLIGALEKDTMTTLMLAGTVVWFASAPMWMSKPGDRKG